MSARCLKEMPNDDDYEDDEDGDLSHTNCSITLVLLASFHYLCLRIRWLVGRSVGWMVEQ